MVLATPCKITVMKSICDPPICWSYIAGLITQRNGLKTLIMLCNQC